MSGRFKRAFRLGGRTREDARASVREELQHHLELCVEELMDEGWSEEEARREARRRFGDWAETEAYCEAMQAHRQTREERSMSFEELLQDIRYAVRTLGRAPGYAALVIVTLAFGIAANTVVFSVMNPYFFRPLPYEQPDELVHIGQVNRVTGWEIDRFSLPIYDDWRTRSRGFEELAAYTYSGANITGPEGPEGVNYSEVTDNLFDVLGTPALIGRTFTEGEGGPGSTPIVVLDHGLWERRYTADPGILGRAIDIDGVAHTVIGVMPPDFTFPFNGVRLWIPTRQAVTEADREAARYLLVGRLNDGWSIERVDAELTGIQTELASVYPDVDGRWSGVTVTNMRQSLNFVWNMMKVAFGVLLGAVVFVLMIACVNVASLTLARAGTRTREIAIRTAMGARRGRVVRQLVTESVLLALVGGGLGVALAYLAAGFIGPVIPEDLYRIGEVSVDGRVLLFSLAVTMLTPLFFGLAPALSSTRRDLTTGLKEGSKGSGGPGSTRGRQTLVVAQVAMAVVLITGAGLMLRSLMSVQDLDLGFESERVLRVTVQPPESDYPSEELAQYIDQAIAELGAIPGVEVASAALYVPLNHETSLWQFASPDRASAPAEDWPTAIANRTYPGYFETMGIPVLAGRDFGSADSEAGATAAIVNEALAERYFPNGDALGNTLYVGEPADPIAVQIVGVVGGVLHEALDGDPNRPQLYRPATRGTFRRHFLLARTSGDPTALFGPAREALTTLDPDLPMSFRSLDSIAAENQLQWSLGSMFLLVFGAGALLLATLGIYGLISFSVAQRQREIGVRIALGASMGQVRGVVLGDGLRLTGIGLGIGVLVSAVLGRLVSSMLFGVSPFDPVTLIAVMILFATVAALASLLPAQRAAATDPIGVLRSE